MVAEARCTCHSQMRETNHDLYWRALLDHADTYEPWEDFDPAPFARYCIARAVEPIGSVRARLLAPHSARPVDRRHWRGLDRLEPPRLGSYRPERWACPLID